MKRFYLFLLTLYIQGSKLLAHLPFTVSKVDGNSMLPTLENKDKLLINTAISNFERGDIVVLNSSYKNKQQYYEKYVKQGTMKAVDSANKKFKPFRCQYYVKRIIGLPGETIDIKDGKVFINGSEVDKSLDFAPTHRRSNYNNYPFQISDDCVFVLGDNREFSSDSRCGLGEVPLKAIQGKAIIRYAPLRKIGPLK